MGDRGKPAAVLLVLAGVLAGVGNLLPMYTAMHTSPVEAFAFSGGLWEHAVVTSPTGGGVNPLLNVGAPVLFTAVVTVVAGLLALRRDRVAPPARVVALGAASAFLGVVLAYTVSVLRDEEMINAFDAGLSPSFDFHFNTGLYLLALAAVLGLAGAVLAQRPRPALPEPDENAVVVHQVMDDDTPPFGIAIGVRAEKRDE